MFCGDVNADGLMPDLTMPCCGDGGSVGGKYDGWWWPGRVQPQLQRRPGHSFTSWSWWRQCYASVMPG